MQSCNRPSDFSAKVIKLSNYNSDDACNRLSNGDYRFVSFDGLNCLFKELDGFTKIKFQYNGVPTSNVSINSVITGTTTTFSGIKN